MVNRGDTNRDGFPMMTAGPHPSETAVTRIACLLLLPLIAGPILAQSRTTTTTTTDPLADATRHFEAREPAATAAGTLRRTHGRAATETAAILRQVGYPPSAVAAALRSEYAATLSGIYRAMKEAAVPPAEITRAFSDNSFSMNCLDPMGNPMPCGVFGGQEDAPVMGQLDWTPRGQGFTDSVLTLTATNMPEMSVRIGAVELQQISATGSQLKVRLPSFAVSGALKVQRTHDPVTGTLESFTVVAPPVPWEAWAGAAVMAARAEVRDWLTGSYVEETKCVVAAPLATGAAGVVRSSHAFQKKVRSALMLQGAPSAVASAWDTAFEEAWKTWADAVVLPGLPLFTTLTTVAADSAPPTAALPMPAIGGFVSTGSTALSAADLAQRILQAIGPHSAASDARTGAVHAFTSDIAERFLQMLLLPSTNLAGRGPVPSFISGNQPGPVVGGRCSAAGVFSAGAAVFP